LLIFIEMRPLLVISLCLLTAFSFSFVEENEPVMVEEVPTGIILDSMNNEVLLVLVNGKPRHYVSEIFTPVCNTGECLPVYINIYWNLNGEYLRFEQPAGEILTKLDHEPFTEEDYKLLDKIIKGQDPRVAQPIPNDHYYESKQDNQGAESSPSPAMTSTVRMDKHDMVDGISGATLPDMTDQFVPGALYTTYTIWGLANDSNHKIRDYTRENLLKKYEYHLLTNPNLQCRADVVDLMAKKKTGDNPRAQVLIDLIDSGDTLLQSAALSQMYYNYYELEEIQAVLDRTFYGESTFMIQRNIIWDWAYKETKPEVLIKISLNLLKYEEHFPELMAIFENKTEYPEGVVSNMITAFPKLQEDNQLIMREFAAKQQEYFSKEDWALIRKMK
jgi:hypothetical protein